MGICDLRKINEFREYEEARNPGFSFDCSIRLCVFVREKAKPAYVFSDVRHSYLDIFLADCLSHNILHDIKLSTVIIMAVEEKARVMFASQW